MNARRNVVAITVCLMIHMVFAGTTWWWATVDGVRWRVSEFYAEYSRIKVAGYEDGNTDHVYPGIQNYGEVVSVPKTLSGSPVTVIGDYTFYECKDIKQIILPATITSIGFKAFWYCKGLETIVVPSSVSKIENYAFCGCSALKTIVFEGDAPSVGTGAFNVGNSSRVAYVMPSSTGWGVSIPGTWNGMKIAYLKSVDFNANGGTVSAPTRWLADGSSVGTLPTPSRTGYTFAGWFTATNGGSQISASTTVSANVTCYAHWTANKYTITFNANGGEGGTSKNLSYDTTLGTLPEATRYDFDFGGWWTAASGGLAISSSTKVTGAATYYAHWIDPIPELTGVVTDDMVSEALSGSADSRITSKITTPSLYNEYRQWINGKELSHKAAKASPNAWFSYALDAPGLMAKTAPLASGDVVIESIAPSSTAEKTFDLVVEIGGAAIGEGARLAEVLGVEGAAELKESAFSSDGLTVTLGRTADGKAKASVAPEGSPSVFFLRVKVK